jgi:hypothetical protein
MGTRHRVQVGRRIGSDCILRARLGPEPVRITDEFDSIVAGVNPRLSWNHADRHSTPQNHPRWSVGRSISTSQSATWYRPALQCWHRWCVSLIVMVPPTVD